jgi:hypothetical protein
MSSFLIDTFVHMSLILKWVGNGIWIHPLFMYTALNYGQVNIKIFYQVCDHFNAPMYQLFFGQNLHRISPKALETLWDIEDWYLEKNYTYIHVYGCNTPPHLLPRYVSEKY